jgi:hypothetical protein
MTVQTKQYIEVSDISAVRFECKTCHATLTLQLAEVFKTSALATCPNCNAWWAALAQGQTIEPTINTFVDAFRNLVDVLKRKKEISGGKDGFSFSLEIRREAELTSSASRGAI